MNINSENISEIIKEMVVNMERRLKVASVISALKEEDINQIINSLTQDKKKIDEIAEYIEKKTSMDKLLKKEQSPLPKGYIKGKRSNTYLERDVSILHAVTEFLGEELELWYEVSRLKSRIAGLDKLTKGNKKVAVKRSFFEEIKNFLHQPNRPIHELEQGIKQYIKNEISFLESAMH